MAGRADSRLIVWTPAVPRLNVIRFVWAVSAFELSDRSPQTAGAAVVGIAHGESGQQLPCFEQLDGRASSPGA